MQCARLTPSGGERGQVPAVHLVGCDAEPLRTTRRMNSGEEAVVAAQQELGRHVGPLRERPRLLERRIGLRAFAPAIASAVTSAGTSWKNVFIGSKSPSNGRRARPARARLVPAGVGPPVARRLARPRHHRGDQDHQVDGHPFAHERRGESAERLRTTTRSVRSPIASTTVSAYSAKPGGVVVAREVDSHDVVAAASQLGNDQVPVPRVGAGAVNQHVRSHAG